VRVHGYFCDRTAHDACYAAACRRIGVRAGSDGSGRHRSLIINPLIQIGQAVQLLASDIQQTLVVQSELSGASITSNQFIATVPNNAPTALFRVIVAEHRGDTRGNDWYTELTCLAIDPSAPINASVNAGT
jgi:hypothetical protein